jgi:hypothetical protein
VLFLGNCKVHITKHLFFYKKDFVIWLVQKKIVPLHDFCIVLTMYLFVSRRLRMILRK